MTLVVMTATYAYKGVTYTNGATVRVRAKDAEAIVAAAKATKSGKHKE